LDDSALLRDLESLRDTMMSVSTGGARIETVNAEHKRRYDSVDRELRTRGIGNTVPFADLWDWHGRWSSGDLPSYRSRRTFLGELFDPMLRTLRDRIAGVAPRPNEPTGWPKVDRTLTEVRGRLAAASTEEQFQAVGLLCREALISLAQAVYDPERHPTLDGVEASSTDAKRMLDAYFAKEMDGGANKIARAHARAAVDLAVELQHKRTATFRAAALCAEATASVINVIAIVSGRRDPEAA
jgi:hypothetical protein